MAERLRSPSYPSISLETAIERAKALYDEEHFGSVHVDVVLGHWKYSPGSGAGLVQIAALKKYGLLGETGKGSNRKVQLTELAKDILIFDDESRKLEAIKTAARLPTLYREVLQKNPDRLPSTASLRTYLIREKGFNPNATEDCIKVLRETFFFAKLFSEDIIEDKNGDGKADRPTDEKAESLLDHWFGKSQHKDKGVPVALPLPVLMDDGSFQVIPIPRMTKKAFEFLKKQLDVYQSAIVLPDRPQAEAPTGSKGDKE